MTVYFKLIGTYIDIEKAIENNIKVTPDTWVLEITDLRNEVRSTIIEEMVDGMGIWF